MYLVRSVVSVLAIGAAFGVLAQSCPLEASGTRNDPKQNVLKNWVNEPAMFTEMTVTEFKQQFKPNLRLPKIRAKFTDTPLSVSVRRIPH